MFGLHIERMWSDRRLLSGVTRGGEGAEGAAGDEEGDWRGAMLLALVVEIMARKDGRRSVERC